MEKQVLKTIYIDEKTWNKIKKIQKQKHELMYITITRLLNVGLENEK